MWDHGRFCSSSSIESKNLCGGESLAPVSRLNRLRLNDTDGKEPFQISLAPNPLEIGYQQPRPGPCAEARSDLLRSCRHSLI